MSFGGGPNPCTLPSQLQKIRRISLMNPVADGRRARPVGMGHHVARPIVEIPKDFRRRIPLVSRSSHVTAAIRQEFRRISGMNPVCRRESYTLARPIGHLSEAFHG